jgi:hypothetical protein
MSEQRPPSKLLPILVLCGMILLAVFAWWVFPYVQGWISNQDCVALGRTNCG